MPPSLTAAGWSPDDFSAHSSTNDVVQCLLASLGDEENVMHMRDSLRQFIAHAAQQESYQKFVL